MPTINAEIMGKQRITDIKLVKASQIYNLVNRMKKDIQEVSEFDLTDYDEFDRHCAMIEQIGSAYMEREFSEFVVDEYNRDVIRFLVYYFNNCKLAENIFPGKDYKVHKNLMILGVPGTGKTL